MDTYDRAVGKAYDGERLCERVELALRMHRKFMGEATVAPLDEAVMDYRKRHPDRRKTAQKGGAL